MPLSRRELLKRASLAGISWARVPVPTGATPGQTAITRPIDIIVTPATAVTTRITIVPAGAGTTISMFTRMESAGT